MLFLSTSLIIGGFRYRKKGGIFDLPLSVPWHRLWTRNTIVTVLKHFTVTLQGNFVSVWPRKQLRTAIYFVFLHLHIQ